VRVSPSEAARPKKLKKLHYLFYFQAMAIWNDKIRYYLIWLFVLPFSIALAANPDTIILSASLPSGLYAGVGKTLTLSSNCAQCQIFYTLDGSLPNQGSQKFAMPIRIDSNAVVMAVAYSNDGRKSKPLGLTYIFNEPTAYPVVSLIIDPQQLFSSSGLFVRGPRASNRFPYKGANWNSDRQVFAYMDFFETDKTLAYSAPCMFKVFGGFSRMLPQKSISLEAVDSLGVKRFKYQFFPDRAVKSFKNIVLRNSGSDFGGTHLRDGFITSLGYEMGLEVQAFRPSVVYINGKYWGIYNIREKLTRNYLASHFGVNKDSVDLMEHNGGRKAGKRQHYEAMRNYMKNNDLSIQKHFDYIATQMDVENFIDYQIVQIFIDNQDAGGNIKYWRPQRPDGRWRWILFDTDFGFGHYGTGFRFNALAFHLEPNGPNWPNPPWSTLNLRMLLLNAGCRDFFVTRFMDRMNTVLSPKHTVERLDSMTAYLLPEIPRHWARWDLEEKRWRGEIKKMREFGQERPAYVRQHLRQMFPHVGREVKLRVEVVGAAAVQLNKVVNIESQPFEGIYFQNLPLKLEAKTGFFAQFSHWEVMGKRVEGTSLEVNFKKDTFLLVRAIFTEGRHPLAQSVVINEIAAADSAAGDWVELYNPSSDDINLHKWQLQDAAGNSFTFPEITLPANGYLVVAQNLKQFKAAYPDCPTTVGDFGFGLDKRKDKVLLFDDKQKPVDSVGYDLPKADKADKNNRVIIALRDHRDRTSNAENWHLEKELGSPALPNPVHIQMAQKENINNIIFFAVGTGAGLGILAVSALAFVRIRQRFEQIK
jgi:hypothetical protein